MTTHTAAPLAADAARAETTNEIATRNGYAFEEDTFFAWGTKLDPGTGAATFRQERTTLNNSPLAIRVLDEGLARVAAEKRADFPVNLPDLHVNGIAAGQAAIRSEKRGYTPIARYALGQLLNRCDAPTGAFPYLSACLVDKRDVHTRQLAADHVNHWLLNARTGKPGKLLPKPAVLRTKLNGAGQRAVYACVSPRFSRECDLDKVLMAVRGVIDPSAKGTLVYDGSRWELTIRYMTTIEPVVGEVFNAVVVVSGADDGSEAINVRSALERVRCINLTRNHAEQSISLRHNRKNLGEVFADALETAHAGVGELAERWADAARAQVAEMLPDGGPRKVFTHLVEQGLVHVAGYGTEELVNRLVKAWEVEPGYTAAAVNNAITRAAHTETWRSAWDTAALEEQAGELLYQTVSVYEVQA